VGLGVGEAVGEGDGAAVGEGDGRGVGDCEGTHAPPPSAAACAQKIPGLFAAAITWLRRHPSVSPAQSSAVPLVKPWHAVLQSLQLA
jgi:hypothetical protein